MEYGKANLGIYVKQAGRNDYLGVMLFMPDLSQLCFYRSLFGFNQIFRYAF